MSAREMTVTKHSGRATSASQLVSELTMELGNKLLAYSCAVFFLMGSAFGQIPSANVAVVSAASFRTSVSLGSIASAFGTQLCPVIAEAELGANGELPTVLGGTVVEVNGIAAGLYYVSPTQINFIIPRSLHPGAATVVIRSGATGVSIQSQINVTDVAPAIFMLGGARADIGAVRNAVTFGLEPFKLETTENAGCDKRTYLSVYSTGLALAAQLGLKVQVEVLDVKRENTAAGRRLCRSVELPRIGSGQHSFTAGVERIRQAYSDIACRYQCVKQS